MSWQFHIRQVTGMVLLVCGIHGPAVSAENEPTDNRSAAERIGSTAKQVGDKIEQGISKAAKKIEDKHLGEKAEQKLKKAASKTAEGFKKAGEKIDHKLRE